MDCTQLLNDPIFIMIVAPLSLTLLGGIATGIGMYLDNYTMPKGDFPWQRTPK